MKAILLAACAALAVGDAWLTGAETANESRSAFIPAVLSQNQDSAARVLVQKLSSTESSHPRDGISPSDLAIGWARRLERMGHSVGRYKIVQDGIDSYVISTVNHGRIRLLIAITALSADQADSGSAVFATLDLADDPIALNDPQVSEKLGLISARRAVVEMGE